MWWTWGWKGGRAKVIHEGRLKAPVFGFFSASLSFGAWFHFFLSLAKLACVCFCLLSSFPHFCLELC